MKKYFIIELILLFIIFGSSTCLSKEKRYDHEIDFGASKGARIIQISGNGDLNITGYKGEKVLVSSNENIFEDDDPDNEKAKGLKKIGGGGFNIINNKMENIIFVSRPIDKNINLDIMVPNNITLKFGNDLKSNSWGKGNMVGQILSGIFGNADKDTDNNFVTGIIYNRK